MKSKLSAQDSLLNGLREERNLWSKELATQGASLASDRGRMESQIEFLSTQVLELQGFQKNCKTTLKIKDKVIEDQVLTIKELKQEVNQLKSELSVSQSEWADKLKILQQKLDDELLENQNVTQQVEMMKGQETYYQIQLQDYCDNERKFKDKYSVLKKQWEERVGLLVQLEENFKKLQETSKRREKDLIIECDRAKNETKQTVQKFQLLQIKFKEQSASLHETIDEKVQIALKDKQKELDTANLKISQVEEDMRNLLSETCKERKTMEAKLDRLSRAFQDVQKELH
jgi:leucine-rich repeat/coiled-coil domain-containing protein 1